MYIKPIPQDLLDVIDYRDGELHWQWGGKAAVKGQNKYQQVIWEGVSYKAHRVVWAWHHGDTDKILDHINRDRIDNRIENLRLSNHRANCLRPNSGVHWDKSKNRWIATLGSKPKPKVVYRGKDLMEAWCRRKSAELHLLTEAAMGRVAQR